MERAFLKECDLVLLKRVALGKDKIDKNNISLLKAIPEFEDSSTIAKENVRTFLESYIRNCENDNFNTPPANIYDEKTHNNFLWTLFKRFDDKRRINLFIASDVTEEEFKKFCTLNNKTRGKFLILEHLFLFEKAGYIRIKDLQITNNKNASKIQWDITVDIIKTIDDIRNSNGQAEVSTNTSTTSNVLKYGPLEVNLEQAKFIYKNKTPNDIQPENKPAKFLILLLSKQGAVAQYIEIAKEAKLNCYRSELENEDVKSEVFILKRGLDNLLQSFGVSKQEIKTLIKSVKNTGYKLSIE